MGGNFDDAFTFGQEEGARKREGSATGQGCMGSKKDQAGNEGIVPGCDNSASGREATTGKAPHQHPVFPIAQGSGHSTDGSLRETILGVQNLQKRRRLRTYLQAAVAAACKLLMNLTNESEAGSDAVVQRGGLRVLSSLLVTACPWEVARQAVDMELVTGCPSEVKQQAASDCRTVALQGSVTAGECETRWREGEGWKEGRRRRDGRAQEGGGEEEVLRVCRTSRMCDDMEERGVLDGRMEEERRGADRQREGEGEVEEVGVRVREGEGGGNTDLLVLVLGLLVNVVESSQAHR